MSSTAVDVPSRAADPPPVSPSGPKWRQAVTAVRRRLDSDLFTDPRPAVRPTRRHLLLGAAAIVAGTMLSLLRTRGAGALNSIWAEDGRDFLADAWNLTIVDAMEKPFNGYWHTGPRMLAEVAARVPVEWGPGVLSTEAALVTAVVAVVVYLASGPYLRHPALRLLVAVPAVLYPFGTGAVENNVATLQFPLLYGLFWALLWAPRSIWGRLAALGIVLFTSTSTALAVLFLPLVLLRLALRRDLYSVFLSAGLAVGAVLEFGGTAAGYATRAGVGIPRYDPIWAFGEYLTKLVPTAVFGEKWMFDRMEQDVCPRFVVSHPADHWVLIVGSWLVVAAVVVVGVRRCRPGWTLAAVAIAHSVGLYSASIMTLGCSANRYFVAPGLMLLTAIAATLRPRPAVAAPPVPAVPSGSAAAVTADPAPADDKDPVAADGKDHVEPNPDPYGGRPGRLTTAAVVFLTLAAVVLGANLRNDSYRSRSPAWTDLVRKARAECASGDLERTVIVTSIPDWKMTVKCSVLDR